MHSAQSLTLLNLAKLASPKCTRVTLLVLYYLAVASSWSMSVSQQAAAKAEHSHQRAATFLQTQASTVNSTSQPTAHQSAAIEQQTH